MTDQEKTRDAQKAPLDDVMIAMDVVDTLRHDKRIVERELDDESRRKDLIKRLRKIYREQGIEVPDHILEEGVKALEEERFAYKPPEEGLQIKLARAYVSRDKWGKFVLGGLAALAVFWGIRYFAHERPRQIAVEQQRVELTETLPASVGELVKSIGASTSDQTILQSAEWLSKNAVSAAQAGNVKAARAAQAELREVLNTLQQDYRIQIVTRKGELSGLWRIPKVNPQARNYYLIVEAVDAKGQILPQHITSEETGKRQKVNSWAVRVPRTVLEAVQADKKDDGIIQNAVVATKPRGKVEPVWRIETSGGAITKW